MPDTDQDPHTDWIEVRMVVTALIAAIATLLVYG